jgi:ankyrin repeat protein
VDATLKLFDQNVEFLDAARNGRVAVVAGLLTNTSILVNKAHRYGETALMAAARAGQYDIVKILLAQPGIEIDQKDNMGNTALIWSAHNGHAPCVEVLISAGANVNLATPYSNTSLTLAAREGRAAVVIALLASPNIDVNLTEHKLWNDTALIEAARGGHKDTVVALLGAPNIQVDQKNQQGQTALSLAIENGHLAVAQIIQKSKAEEGSLSKRTFTPNYDAPQIKNTCESPLRLHAQNSEINHLKLY